MKAKKLRAELERAIASGEPIRITSRRQGRRTVYKGFPVGLGADGVLLHTLNLDPFVMNGYTYLPLHGQSHIERFEEVQPFVLHALQLLDMNPVVPDGVNTASLEDLIRTASERYPVVSIWENDKTDGYWLIGRVLKVGRYRVKMQVIDKDGEWSNTYRIAFKDIGAVDFDDGYGRALWRVNQELQSALILSAPNGRNS